MSTQNTVGLHFDILGETLTVVEQVPSSDAKGKEALCKAYLPLAKSKTKMGVFFSIVQEGEYAVFTHWITCWPGRHFGQYDKYSVVISMRTDYARAQDPINTAAIWDALKEARQGDHLWQRWLAVVQETVKATKYNTKFLEISTSTGVKLDHNGYLNMFYTVRDWGRLLPDETHPRGTRRAKTEGIEEVVESLDKNADLIAAKVTNPLIRQHLRGGNLVFLWRYPRYYEPEWELSAPLLYGQTVHLLVKGRAIKMRIQIGGVEITQDLGLGPGIFTDTGDALENALKTTYDICGALDHSEVTTCLLQNGWVDRETFVFQEQGIIKA